MNSDLDKHTIDLEPSIRQNSIKHIKVTLKRPRGIMGRVKKDSKTKRKSKETLHTDIETDLNIKIKKEKPSTKKKKIILAIVLILVGFISAASYLSYVYVYQPAMRIKRSAETIKQTTEHLKASFEAKDLTTLEADVETIRVEMGKIDYELSQYKFLSKLSVTKGYYENLKVVRNTIDKTDVLLDTNLPRLKTLFKATGFKVDAAEVVVPENADKEDTAAKLVLKELPQYISVYKEMEPGIVDIFNEINKLDPQYVPNIGGYDIKAKLSEFKDITDEYPQTSKDLVEFLEYVPDLLGSSKTTSYLLILQNESEMRSSGGLITAYGNMTITNGEVGEIRLSDTWNLENYVSYDLGIDTGNRNEYGQLWLMLNGCGAAYQRAQDSGVYPDLMWTMNKFREYYDEANYYNPTDFPSYDKILIINFAFSENLLELIQPLEVEGFGQVTADTLFNFIKAETDDRELSYSPERKKIIQDIANAVKNKLFTLKFDQIIDLSKFAIQGFQARDIGIISLDPNLQTNYLSKYGMSGEFVKTFDGDYFHMNEAQNCSLKLNKFVRDEVTQDVTINADGSINKLVKVLWQQPQVYDESLKDQYSPLSNFSYRAWIRFFVPKEVQTIESEGYGKSGYLYYYPETYYDGVLDKTVSDNIIQFDHRRFSDSDEIPSQDISIFYSLPASLNYNSKGIYKMLIQKHPGKSWGEKYTVNIDHNGKKYSVSFVLDRDKVLTYRDGVITVDNYDKSLDRILEIINDVPAAKN